MATVVRAAAGLDAGVGWMLDGASTRRKRSGLAAIALSLVLAGATTGSGRAQEPGGHPPAATRLDSDSPEVIKRVRDARVKTIETLPPEFWAEVLPGLLKGVPLERLKTEKGAVVIVRAYGKSADGDEIPYPYNFTLREVNTDRIRQVLLRSRGAIDQLGWGVAVVPPGRYLAANAPATISVMLRSDGTMAHRITFPLGAAKVAPERGVRVEAGEVVYLGTVVESFRQRKPPPQSVTVIDQSAAARAFAQQEFPAFAPHLQTRLLPSVDPVELQ